MEGDGMKIIESKQAEYKEYVAKNSGDGYSKGVVDYAERWADLMEKALETWRGGNELSPASVMRFLVDNADKLSHEADTDGITGFMYGCAVSALAHFWIHGEELRRWHNLKTQIRNEGEAANRKPGAVLNPALLNVK
jgi:hypothetical protein